MPRVTGDALGPIATELVYEDDHVRVWTHHLAPGEASRPAGLGDGGVDHRRAGGRQRHPRASGARQALVERQRRHRRLGRRLAGRQASHD